MKSKIFELLYRLLIITFAILGLCLNNPYGNGMQFWFFTSQTNAFVVIIEAIICVLIIINICGKETHLAKNNVFSLIRLMITFFITITGIIYMFVLAPTGIAFAGKSASYMFNFRNIILHAVVPVMSIIGYYAFANSGMMNKNHAWYFLIYPFIYFVLAIFRVEFGGKPFYDGTLYPYFFIDPTIGGQGWGMVAIYVAVIIVLFYALARLYIHINNKLSKGKENQ